MSFAIDRKPWRRADLVAFCTGMIVYALLIVGRRTFLTANATAAIWPAAGVMAATFLLTPPKAWKWILLLAVGENMALNGAFGFVSRTLISIPEAVFLSHRVVVMSPRPGRIAEIIDVGLGERSDDTRESPQFYAAITQVREALRGKPVPPSDDVAADIERAQGAL